MYITLLCGKPKSSKKVGSKYYKYLYFCNILNNYIFIKSMIKKTSVHNVAPHRMTKNLIAAVATQYLLIVLALAQGPARFLVFRRRPAELRSCLPLSACGDSTTAAFIYAWVPSVSNRLKEMTFCSLCFFTCSIYNLIVVTCDFK